MEDQVKVLHEMAAALEFQSSKSYTPSGYDRAVNLWNGEEHVGRLKYHFYDPDHEDQPVGYSGELHAINGYRWTNVLPSSDDVLVLLSQ